MSRGKTIILGFAFACQALGAAEAQSLRVSPITIDLPPGSASSFLNVGTNSDRPVTVQARVFRWTQAGGEDRLEKTGDAVVSPPFQTVSANSSAIVRVVRIAQTPVAGEECYRVLLDEIPDCSRLRAGTVAFALRQSIPIFFNGTDASRGELRWTLLNRGRRTFLRADNADQKRVKLTSLSPLRNGHPSDSIEQIESEGGDGAA